MKRFLLYFLFVIIVGAFFAGTYFFYLFNEGLRNLTKIREASSSLKKISMDSMRIYSGLDVSNSVEELKKEKERFKGFLIKNKGLKGINYEGFSTLFREAEININLLVKNERNSKDFFRAYHEMNNLTYPIIEELEILEKKMREEIKSNIIKFTLANIIVIFSLPLFFVFLQKKARLDLMKKKHDIKIHLENLFIGVEELADEIEEISTKTIKLSLRKSESGYSTITNSLEEMRKKIDFFIKESFDKEKEDYIKNFNNLIDFLSLSLNSIIASTMMEMEKFKEMEKSLEKINEKLSFLKKKVAELSLSIKNTQKFISK